MKVFQAVIEVIAILVALVNIVERSGEGEQKRREVIDLFFEKGKEHLTTLPKWASDLFLRRTFIGWLVDVIVWAANAYGPFGESQNSERTSGALSNAASTASA